MTTRPLDEHERALILGYARVGLTLLAHYGVAEPREASPAKVGAALDSWRCDNSDSRPEAAEVIQSLGCLLGLFIEKSRAGNWVVTSDTSLGIVHARTGVVMYPLDVISKTASGADLVWIVDVFAKGGPQNLQNLMKAA